MSVDDVSPNEMNAPHDFDDAAAEALLSGHGGEVDPRLAELLDNLRLAYTSNPPVGAELSALIGGTVTAPPVLVTDSRRFERMRSSIMAKVAVAVAAMFAATGSLAVANALPAPIQNVAAHLGVGAPADHDDDAAVPADEETTTTTEADETTDPVEPTPTTVQEKDNHGSEVSAVAHDHSVTGCEHGAAVSKVASDGRSHNDGSCDDTSTTTPEATPPADAKGHDGDDHESNELESDAHPKDEHQKDEQDHESESDDSDSSDSESGGS